MPENTLEVKLAVVLAQHSKTAI